MMKHLGVSLALLVTAVATVLVTLPAQAQNRSEPVWPILSDARLLKATGINIISVEPASGAAYARVNTEQRLALTRMAHKWNRCGGYEALKPNESPNVRLNNLRQMEMRNLYTTRAMRNVRSLRRLSVDPKISAAVAQVSDINLKSTVTFLSNFPNRYNRAKNPNAHIGPFQAKLQELAKAAKFPIKIDLIDHESTPQKSIRVHIEGKTRPNEIVVLGGHLDSINGMSPVNGIAPGADDNASGSSNILEAFRIMTGQEQPARSVEFFWYAGEESGLLGSKEIARAYRKAGKDVVAVLQLDMTLFPGSGEFVLGSMNDFTSPWLRDYLTSINDLYIHAKIVNDKCGYGCSDHASWHSEGYPALMPFEATMRTMNENIHTEDDKIDTHSNFRHSAMFAKIAVAFAMDLGNTDQRSP